MPAMLHAANATGRIRVAPARAHTIAPGNRKTMRYEALANHRSVSFTSSPPPPFFSSQRMARSP